MAKKQDSKPTRAFAPGKLFLFGEYAVVAGAWSIVAAVKIGATVTLRPSPSSYCIRNGASVESSSELADLPQRVLNNANSNISVDRLESNLSEIFYQQKFKLGVGSSSASCAAVAALADPNASAEERFIIAAKAHRSFQNGRGSHADVAAATFGGIIAYRLHDAVPPFSPLTFSERSLSIDTDLAVIEPLRMPTDLEVYGYWTGEPSNSRVMVKQVEEKIWAKETTDALNAIAKATEFALQGFDSNSAQIVFDAAREAHLAMRDLERATGVDIWTEKSMRLEALLQGLPVHVKMSGAGGGDFALVFALRGTVDWEETKTRVPGYWLKVDDQVEGAHIK